jgi:multiple sugar transport system permease protein
VKVLEVRRKLRHSATGYAFASPWLVGFFLLALGPMVVSLLFAFISWDGISVKTIEWVGVGNFTRAARDPDVGIALRNTAYYSFVSVPIGMVVALALAVLLNQPLRGISVFRTIFYMPSVIGGVATIMMWIWVFNPEYGLLNDLLRQGCRVLAALGIEQATRWEMPKWIFSDRWAMPSMILMSLWGAGGSMLIFLAALQNVPDSLYEAADLDGAGRWHKFIHITVPQISPAIFFNLVMGIIGSFQVFTQAFLMTGGGPNKSTLFYVLHLYNKAFRDFEIGYASALAWILFAIIMVLTLLVLRSSKVWVYYEGE